MKPTQGEYGPMTIKSNLLATVGPMTLAEAAMGRYMRAPDHRSTNDFDSASFDVAENEEEGLDSEDDNEDNEDSGDEGDDNDAEEPDEEDGEEEGDDNDAEEDAEDDTPKDKRSEALKKRIAKLQRRLDRAEAEKRNPQNKTPDKPGKSDEKPKVTDFDSYEDYVEALTEYKAEQVATKREQANAERQANKEFAQRYNKGMKAFKDWDDVVTDDVEITVAMQQAIKDTDEPAAVVYYLANNPDEAERIGELPNGKQMLEIGKIEAKLAKKPGGDKAPTKKTSKAPDPITPSKRGGKGLKKTYEEMDVDDFINTRNKEERG